MGKTYRCKCGQRYKMEDIQKAVIVLCDCGIRIFWDKEKRGVSTNRWLIDFRRK